MIVWDELTERHYHYGLDRGTLYFPEGDGALPWSGLVNVEDGTEAPNATMLYRDGVVVMADVDASDWTGKLTALTYPTELSPFLGMPQIVDGFFVDNQKPRQFNMSYRTLVGSGAEGDLFGHQIHLLYNLMASINTRSRQSINEQTNLTQFSMDLVATPVGLPGYRPSAHYIIDSRYINPSILEQIEGNLYGDDGGDGYLQPPAYYFNLMNYGDNIKVTHHVAEKTFTVEGSNDNIRVYPDGSFEVDMINATAPNVNGEYTISDGGTTTVVND